MSREPLTQEEAVSAAKAAGADYLVTTKLTRGKTHFWGFLIIPFVEPVWTTIGFEVNVFDLSSGRPPTTFQTLKSVTDWKFGKIFILDSVFDGMIFGKRWHRKIWGEAVVSDALAEAVHQIAGEIGKGRAP